MCCGGSCSCHFSPLNYHCCLQHIFKRKKIFRHSLLFKIWFEFGSYSVLFVFIDCADILHHCYSLPFVHFPRKLFVCGIIKIRIIYWKYKQKFVEINNNGAVFGLMKFVRIHAIAKRKSERFAPKSLVIVFWKDWLQTTPNSPHIISKECCPSTI